MSNKLALDASFMMKGNKIVPEWFTQKAVTRWQKILRWFGCFVEYDIEILSGPKPAGEYFEYECSPLRKHYRIFYIKMWTKVVESGKI